MTSIDQIKLLAAEEKFNELDYEIDNLNVLDLKVLNTLAGLKAYSSGLDKFRLKILRTFSIDPYLKIIAGAFVTRKFDLSVQVADYGQVETELYSNSNLSKGQDALLVFERLEDILPEKYKSLTFLSAEEEQEVFDIVLNRLNGMISKYQSDSSVPFLYAGYFSNEASSMSVSTFKHHKTAKSLVRKLNLEVMQLLQGRANCFYLDIQNAIEQTGSQSFFDHRLNSMFQAPFSTNGFVNIAAAIANIAWALKGKTKKCLVLDCDNTLWGGVIGEDGMEGIKLGPDFPGVGFVQFQRFAKSLTRHGAILALNSKNNETDALEVLEKHPHVVLKKDDIASYRINWETKVQNINEIAQELNISLDSLVFVDDSDFECQMVKQAFPQVTVKRMPKDELAIMSFMDSFFQFESVSFSEEDKQRSQMYQAQVQRKNLEKSFDNMQEFYKSLEIEIDFHVDDVDHIPRISQLSQKTNQFNLTTKRYSEAEIKSFMEDENTHVFSLVAKDKFGNNGITGVCIAKKENAETQIDSFFLSCRIIGRGIEKSFICFVVDVMGQGVVKSEFIRTAKNKLVENFFDGLHFELVQKDENHKKYQFDTQSLSLEHPEWISWSAK